MVSQAYPRMPRYFCPARATLASGEYELVQNDIVVASIATIG